ncbi:MAG: hypothetical protein LW875_05665 [Proteobacteria bacterium]|nr:hypothetical protein [Pseudomonadota bacterium]
MTKVKFTGLFIFLTLFSFQTQALSCKFVYHEQSNFVRAVVEGDAYRQWMKWEQTDNLAKYRKSTEAIQIPVSEVSLSQVIIEKSFAAPESLLNFFKSPSGGMLWPKHPHNTSDTVPFFNEPVVNQRITAYYTSSRSLALDGALRGFTIKLPTDHPHGPLGEYQPSKLETNDDVLPAIRRSEHIMRQDQILNDDPMLKVMPEALTISAAGSRIGAVIRDVRLLDDGHYYLPALSLPFAGRKISLLNNSDFESFWAQHYAAALGEAKARMLLRYGLQMETPNPQNMLIQLNRDLQPTGVIVFRDISDAYVVEAAATGLGLEAHMNRERQILISINDFVMPYVSNSLWRLDQAGPTSLSREGMRLWAKEHNEAYIRQLEIELQLQLPRTDGINDTLSDVYEVLKSPLGQQKFREWREKNTRKAIQPAA